MTLLPDDLQPVTSLLADRLQVQVYRDRSSLGRAAASFAAKVLEDRKRQGGRIRVVFAAAPSQNELLASLVESESIDWSSIDAFHMDEYLGLDAKHPASFRRYLNDRVFDRKPFVEGSVNLIPGESDERPARTALDYEISLSQTPIDLVLAGIGENGHLAFNDPPVADFLDPHCVKVVRLDRECRTQQVNDGCFARLDDVPTHAFTLTIPALMSTGSMVLAVPGERKARAVHAAVRGPIDESCPASIVRTHPNARLFLDLESARLIL